MKYKLVKPITPRAILNNLPDDCPEALREFHNFLDKLGSINIRDLSLNSKMSEAFVNEMIDGNETWKVFLITNGVIKESEPELTFSIGDKFQSRTNGTHRWILAAVPPGLQINLIRVWPPSSSDMGAHFSAENEPVSDLRNITLKEFEALIGGEYEHMLRRTTSRRSMRYPHPSTLHLKARPYGTSRSHCDGFKY